MMMEKKLREFSFQDLLGTTAADTRETEKSQNKNVKVTCRLFAKSARVTSRPPAGQNPRGPSFVHRAQARAPGSSGPGAQRARVSSQRDWALAARSPGDRASAIQTEAPSVQGGESNNEASGVAAGPLPHCTPSPSAPQALGVPRARSPPRPCALDLPGRGSGAQAHPAQRARGSPAKRRCKGEGGHSTPGSPSWGRAAASPARPPPPRAVFVCKVIAGATYLSRAQRRGPSQGSLAAPCAPETGTARAAWAARAARAAALAGSTRQGAQREQAGGGRLYHPVAPRLRIKERGGKGRG